MTHTPEEERALLSLTNEQRRVAFQRQLQARLKAPSERAIQTKKNWAPVRRTNG